MNKKCIKSVFQLKNHLKSVVLLIHLLLQFICFKTNDWIGLNSSEICFDRYRKDLKFDTLNNCFRVNAIINSNNMLFA